MTDNEALSALHFLLGYEKAVDKGEIEGNSFLNLQEKEALQFILEEVQQYRAMEQRLKNIYGECDGLLEVVISGLERHENLELPSITVKSRLLTDEDVDMWDEYRAIGTVARFEQLSKQFAPHNTDETSCGLRHCNKCNMYRKENEKYHEIGTIEEFNALKEKSVAKKPIDKSKNPIDWHVMACPNCEHIFWNSGQFVHYEPKFCNYCGQKLDWND